MLFRQSAVDVDGRCIFGRGWRDHRHPTAVSDGGEIELTYKPAPDWIIFLSGTYLDAHYTDFVGASAAGPLREYIFTSSPNVNFDGKELNSAPRETAFLSAEKQWNVEVGKLNAKAELEYSDKFYFASDNVAPLDQGACAKVNLSLRYQSERAWTATAYVRNLSDKVTKTSASLFTTAVGARFGGSVSDPRTFGVRLGYRF